jgi:hypothetical protein
MTAEQRQAPVEGIGIKVANTLYSPRQKKQYRLLITDEFDYTIFKNSPIIGSMLDKEYGWVEVHKNIAEFFFSARGKQVLLFYFSGHTIPEAMMSILLRLLSIQSVLSLKGLRFQS